MNTADCWARNEGVVLWAIGEAPTNSVTCDSMTLFSIGKFPKNADASVVFPTAYSSMQSVCWRSVPMIRRRWSKMFDALAKP